MLNLKAKIRKESGKKVKELREKGILPGVLYGPKIDNVSLQVDLKEFEKVYKEAGESSLVSLDVDKKNFSVLVRDLELNPISQKPIHVDFYQPRLDEEITVAIPLVFEGESLAVKDLFGTLVKNIHEIEVKAFPQNLPHEIKVNISALKTFDDEIKIKDLVVPELVKIVDGPEEIIALVTPLEKEEELEKPVEDVEKVEKVEQKKTEEDVPAE